MRGPDISMTLNDSTDLPLPSLRALIDRYGTLAIGMAYLRAAFARLTRPPGQGVSALSDHILRDIGLPPQDNRRGWNF